MFTRSRGAALELLGFEPGEVVGQSLFDVYGENPDICRHARCAFEGEPTSTTTTTAGGIEFDSWYQPIETEDGEVVGAAGLAYAVSGHDGRGSPTDDQRTDGAE